MNSTSTLAPLGVAMVLAVTSLPAAADQTLFDDGRFLVKLVDQAGSPIPWRCDLWHPSNADSYTISIAPPGVLFLGVLHSLTGELPVVLRAGSYVLHAQAKPSGAEKTFISAPGDTKGFSEFFNTALAGKPIVSITGPGVSWTLSLAGSQPAYQALWACARAQMLRGQGRW